MSQWKNWKGSKFKAVGSRDAETAEWIPSKLEARVLKRFRDEADEKGFFCALHPRCKIEGGHATGDVALIQKSPPGCGAAPDERPWFHAWVMIADAKGVLTRESKKSIKQISERYAVSIHLVRK